LALVSVALSFLALELYVRLVIDDGLNYGLEMWKYATQMKQVSEDANIGHEHRPDSRAHLMGVDVATNAAKLRDRNYPLQKPADTTRVLMLGDSITMGWGVEVSDTVAKRLEVDFSERYPNRHFEVINAGVGNYNTAMEVSWFLSSGLAYEPDIVVLNYFVNDAEPTPKRRGGFLRERSAAYVFLANRIDTAVRQYAGGDWLGYYRELYTVEAPGWVIAQARIRELARACQEQNIDLVVASYPELHQLDPYPFAAVNDALATLTSDLGISFIDLLPAVAEQTPQTLWVTPGDAHPNAAANRKYAGRLSTALESLVSR
jgi:lysophospholipase L1-like esterase